MPEEDVENCEAHQIDEEDDGDGEVFDAAVDANVAFVPGTHFYPDGGHANTFRLNFSMQEAENIRTGMQRLGEALRGE